MAMCLRGKNVIFDSLNPGRPEAFGGQLIDGQGMPPHEIFHEVGHIIEDRDPEILRRDIEFRDSRTQGDNPIHLGPEYEPHEYALPDEWKERGGSLYTGKLHRKADGSDYASEILSTGLERLYKDPSEFYMNDPHFFEFVVNSIRNFHP